MHSSEATPTDGNDFVFEEEIDTRWYEAANFSSSMSVLLTIVTLASDLYPPLVVGLSIIQIIDAFIASFIAGEEGRASKENKEDCKGFISTYCNFCIGFIVQGQMSFGAVMGILQASQDTAMPLLELDHSIYLHALTTMAIGQAIKSGYEFLTSAATLYYSEKDGEALNAQRREVLLQGLKFIGFTLIGFGSLSAGSAFLVAAAAITLYNHGPQLRNFFGSALTFFSSATASTPKVEEEIPLLQLPPSSPTPSSFR